MTWLNKFDDGGKFDFKKWAQKTGKFEGWEETVYRDTKGILTIGYGFNLEDPSIRAKLKAKGLDVTGMLNGNVKITQEQALPILEEIYKESYETARSKFSNFDTFPDEVKHTVTDMVYNMGEPTFDEFKKMKKALLLNDYAEASRQIADSSYAQQTGNRAKQHINTLLTIGNAPNVQPFMREKMEPIQIAPMREIKSVSPSSYEEEVVQVSPRVSDVPETPQAEPKIDSTDTYVWTPGGKVSVKDFVKQYGKKVFESTFNKPVPEYKNGGKVDDPPIKKKNTRGYYVSNTPHVAGTDWSEGLVPANYWSGTYSIGPRKHVDAYSYQKWLAQQKGYTDLEKAEGVTLPVAEISVEKPGYVESVVNDFGEALDPTTSMFYNPMAPQAAIGASLLAGGFEALSLPQKSIVYGLSGRYARPHEVHPTRGLGNFGNQVSDFMFSGLTDPLMYPQLLGKGLQGVSNIAKAAIPEGKNLLLSSLLASRLGRGTPMFETSLPPRFKRIDPINRSSVNVQSDIHNLLSPEEYDEQLKLLYDTYKDQYDFPLVEFKGARPTSNFVELNLGKGREASLLKEKFCLPGSECAKTANAVTSRTFSDITGKPFEVNQNAHNAWHMEDQMTRYGGENVTNDFLKIGDRILMGNGVNQSTYVPGYTADKSVRHAGMFAGIRNVDGTIIPVLFESGASNPLYMNPVENTFTGINSVRQVIRPRQFLGDEFGKALADKNIRYAFRDKPSVATYSSTNKAAQNILDQAEQHRERVKRTYDITNDEFDEFRNSLIGIGAQETKLGGQLEGSALAKVKIDLQDALVDAGLTKPIKQVLNSVKKTLNAAKAKGDLPAYPGSSTIEMEAALLSKEKNIPLNEAINEVAARYEPKPRFTLSTPEASKGIFRQKFQTSTDRLSGVNSDIVGEPIGNALGQMAENYNKIKRAYPNATPRQLIDLTTLMWNSPGKALNSSLVDFYMFGKNNPNPAKFKFDYVDKINKFKDDLLDIRPQSVEPHYEFFRNSAYPEIQYKDGGLTLPYWKDLDKQYYINSDRTPREYGSGGWTDLNRRYGYYGQYPGYKNGGPTGTGSSQTDDKIVYEPYVGPEEEQKPGVVRPYGTNAQGETVYRPTTGYYLPEVEVSTDRPDTYNNYFLDKNRDAGLAYSMFMLPADYALGFLQAYATKLLTGKYQLPSEAMGIDPAVSPIKAIAANAIFDPVNLLGVGLLNKEKALAALASSKESGMLSNAYKYNPWAFKPNPEAYYRGIGKAGMDDALTTGVLRPNRTGKGLTNNTTYDAVFFDKGRTGLANALGEGNIAEVRDIAMKEFSPNHMGVAAFDENTGKFLSEVPLGDNTKLLKKDWLRGYKEVPKKEDGGTIYGLGSHVAHGGPTWPEYAMGLDSGATLHQTLDALRGNPQPKILDTSAQGNVPKKAVYPSYYDQGVKKYSLPEEGRSLYGKGGMIKRADGSYSRRGLWDNIRANKGSGKKPTKQMLEQERKIRAAEKKEHGGHVTDEYKKVRSTVPRVAYTAPSTMGSGPWTQRGITFADGSYIGILPMTNTSVPAPRYNKTPDKAVMPVVYANEPNTPDWSKGAKFEDGGWLDNI
jgi:GH24 family phage-related lysozyme (muramidase)